MKEPVQTFGAKLDDAVARFEAAWRRGTAPELAAFVPAAADAARVPVLIEIIKIDQEYRWRGDDKRMLEEYLAAWPELNDQPAAVVELIAAECLTRGVLGAMPSFKELRTRFPRLCEQVPLAQIAAEAEQERQRKVERPMNLLQEGQEIRATYQVERLLGEGAFAEVYRVKHNFLGRQAMKVFKMVGMTIQETNEMMAEAMMLSRIGHPNIIRVFEANIMDTSRGISSFFTMEYVAGGNLEQFWQSYRGLFMPVEMTVEIIRQVCCGLAVAHAENPPIVHRDIKPQNILIGYDAAGLRARLTDFGLAKHVNPLTLLASARGTRSFKAPEVFRDPQSDSCAGDVWALGSTLYLLLTDRLPYADMGTLASLDETFTRPLIPPSQCNAQVDPLLESIVLRTLAPKPADRYLTAKELLADLAQWQPRSRAKSALAGTSKDALGLRPPLDEARAQQQAARAVEIAKQASRLAEAADLLEEAINQCPELHERYEYQLRLWRRGVVM